jgi:hypothetical protein
MLQVVTTTTSTSTSTTTITATAAATFIIISDLICFKFFGHNMKVFHSLHISSY